MDTAIYDNILQRWSQSVGWGVGGVGGGPHPETLTSPLLKKAFDG